MTLLEMMDKIYDEAQRQGGRFETEGLRYQLRATKGSPQGYRNFQRAVEYMRILGWIQKPGRNGLWSLRPQCKPLWAPKRSAGCNGDGKN